MSAAAWMISTTHAAEMRRRSAVPPGPIVGRALARLLEEALDDPATNDRARQIARLTELAGDLQGGSP